MKGVPVTISTWRSIASRLEADITSGTLAEGSRLPPESSMARDLGISRHTLRRAIAALVTKGLLVSVPHGGNTVGRLRISFPLTAVTQISQVLEDNGLTPGNRLLASRECPPPPEVAAQLRVAQLTHVIELKYLRTANSLPFCVVTAWAPADRFSKLAEFYSLSGSLRRALIQSGVPQYKRETVKISCRMGDPLELRQLDLAPRSIVMVMEVLNVDMAGEPINVAIYRFAAGRIEFMLEPGR